MGILTLLRNAFGRGRKGRPAEAESADHLPTPRQEHNLVTEAFDTPRVPAQGATDSPKPPEPEAEAPTKSPEPETPVESPEAEAATESADTAAPETAPAADAPVTPEPEAPEIEAAEIEPLLMEPAILDADPELVVPQQRTEPLPEAEAEHDAQPAIPEQSTEPAADTISATNDEQDVTPDPRTKASAEADTNTAEQLEAKAEPEPEANAEPQAKAPTEPKPTPEAEAEPKATPEPETTPEPKASAQPEPETTPAPEATAETEPASAPAPDAQPKATPEPKATAEPELEITPEPKASAEPEPEITPEPGVYAEPEPASALKATPAPEAADAPAPPRAAPADDDASRTGGAGGNTAEAEGAAEAEPLRSTPSAAAATLAKTDLTGTAAKLYLVLDRSSSMRPYYRDGSAQALADQTLALAAHLDKDPTVHVVFFSTEVDGTTDLTLTEDHTTKIDTTHARLGRMGRTNYHAAVAAVLAHHDQHNAPEDDVLVVFQVDGAPDAKTPATLALANAAKTHPKVFFSFVAFGDPDNRAFDYLRRLKTGNTSFFHAGPTPRELTDTELYEGVLATWRP
ncbi:VWA domain-containing protein [Streptomyces seoulensis]|uniref:VWA domain-containing protein n=1 Tax=Streptomyces seoulensis TaxID=73044 RepID=UPI00365A75C4